jgi:hypothetical protein
VSYKIVSSDKPSEWRAIEWFAGERLEWLAARLGLESVDLAVALLSNAVIGASDAHLLSVNATRAALGLHAELLCEVPDDPF